MSQIPHSLWEQKLIHCAKVPENLLNRFAFQAAWDLHPPVQGRVYRKTQSGEDGSVQVCRYYQSYG